MEIRTIMLKNHNKIGGLFNTFKRALNDRDKEFDKFKWELEKHFFIEENVIFSNLNVNNRVIASNLIEEHKTMLKMLDSIKSSLADKKKLDSFESLMNKHRGFEDSEFYPALDKELSAKEKKELIDKVNNVKMY
ncbi:MAG: hemerythrin domain-containing protein [archaeon]